MPLMETKTEHGAGKDDDPKCLPEVFDSGLKEKIYRLTDGGLISVRPGYSLRALPLLVA